MPLEELRSMVKIDKDISMSRQCQLLNIHRSGVYYSPILESDENLDILRLMDKQYFETPFYGILRISSWLKKLGYKVNHKRIKRLMGLMRWQTIYRPPNTSKPNKRHLIYPYLLKELAIEHANQVWQVDITYIQMRKGFMYLFAIIDVHSR